MTYFTEVANNICKEVENTITFEQIEQIVNIVNSLLALVVIIIGLNWLKPLKEKQNAASFTFWSQVYIRLIKINSYLKSNNNCLFYWYSNTARAEWQGILAPNPDDFLQLKAMVEETLTFLQDANDQMPPYEGWTEDYTNLLSYLTDMISYDICLSNGKFKYKENTSYNQYLQQRNLICALITLMCDNVKSKQNSIEYKLTVVWYIRIYEWFTKNKHNRKEERQRLFSQRKSYISACKNLDDSNKKTDETKSF